LFFGAFTDFRGALHAVLALFSTWRLLLVDRLKLLVAE
jgi:hypothetical protein